MAGLTFATLAVLALVTAVVFRAATVESRSRTRRPPYAKGAIPYLSTTIQFMTDAGGFIDQVNETLRSTGSSIVKFYLGLTPAYIVTGPENVQKVLNSPESLDGTFLQLVLMAAHWDLSRQEINKFRNDKSGRSQAASAPGPKSVLGQQRYWHGHDRLFADYLSPRKYSDALAATFYRLFSERLVQQPGTEWVTIRLFEFLKDAMAESAMVSLFGSRLVELNPGIVQAYWDFDDIAGPLAFGPPRFLQRRSIRIRNRLHAMIRRQIDAAWESFDWDGPDAEADWEPHFGSRLSRETARWLRQNGFSNHAAAGHTLASLYGLNGNTIPLTAWSMIELIKDTSLIAEVRAEALSVSVIDPETGVNHIDAQRLVNLPLMQSLYVEIMRLHVSFNPLRKAVRPLIIDGCTIEEGALVQTCSQIAHREEAVWGVEGHPASEFWAWRHVKSTEETDDTTGETKIRRRFAMAGRPSSFFPYGGGYVMCPGRYFAKQEILLAIAMIVTRFDLEFVEWTHLDGSGADRAPEDDRSFAGFIATPPNGDVKIRWRSRESACL